MIQGGGQLYKQLAKVLNAWENHRTPTEFMDNMIMKNFAFEFVVRPLVGMHLWPTSAVISAEELA